MGSAEAARPAGQAAVHARHLPDDAPRPALDDAPVRRLRHGRGDEPAVPLPAERRADRPVVRVRSPDADGLRLRPSARRGRGRQGRRRDRLDRRHADAARRPPAREGHDVDDDQLDGGDPAAALRAGRRGAGRRGSRHRRRHDPERPSEGVHRPRHLHLPAASVDAPDHRHLRLLQRAHPSLEHDLDLRLPHPRSRIDGRAGDRVHDRERHRVRAGRDRRGAAGRRVRAAAVVLLERAQQLPRGDREVPGRARASGTRSWGSGSVPRRRRRSCCASTPRPAARRSPHSNPRTTSCASRCRRSQR